VALLSRFFGRTASEGAAFALGVATGPVLAPAVEEIKNEAWRTHPSRTVDATGAAEIVAEDVERRDWGANEASAHGIDGDRLDAIVGAVLNAPGMGELVQARRRKLISAADFRHGLRKAKLELLWDDALIGLLDVLLSPADLAMARQQGFVDERRQKTESALQGVDDDRAEILFQLSGLPPGVDVAQRAANRDFIDRDTFEQIVREGHTKTKYTDLLWRMRNPLLTAAIGVRLYLKGWWTKAQRDELGSLWGYTSQQMEDWYLASGRPAAPGQMATAAARGIDGPDGRPMDRDQFLKGIKESDIRPEWGPMLWDSRYLYPPLFQLTRLVQGGAIDPDTARDWAVKDRYPPEVVAALHAYWSKPAAAGQTNTVEKLSTTQARAALKKRYLIERIDTAGVLTGLELLGSDPAEAGHILEMWTLERGWLVRPLTPSQIKKLYREGTITLDQGIEALEELHYTPGDAEALLTS
jgi:hypothetical protein